MIRYFDLHRPFFRQLAVAVSITLCALIAYLSLAPASGLPTAQWSDKVNHFIAYASLGVPLAIALGKERWLAAIAIATAYGAFMELAQGSLTAGRTADLIDGIANALGACAGVAIGYVLLLWRR